jgi:hypothetical protein
VRRREFIAAFGGAAVAPLVANAQQGKLARIGALVLTSADAQSLARSSSLCRGHRHSTQHLLRERLAGEAANSQPTDAPLCSVRRDPRAMRQPLVGIETYLPVKCCQNTQPIDWCVSVANHLAFLRALNRGS